MAAIAYSGQNSVPPLTENMQVEGLARQHKHVLLANDPTTLGYLLEKAMAPFALTTWNDSCLDQAVVLAANAPFEQPMRCGKDRQQKGQERVGPASLF